MDLTYAELTVLKFYSIEWVNAATLSFSLSLPDAIWRREEVGGI